MAFILFAGFVRAAGVTSKFRGQAFGHVPNTGYYPDDCDGYPQRRRASK